MSVRKIYFILNSDEIFPLLYLHSLIFLLLKWRKYFSWWIEKSRSIFAYMLWVRFKAKNSHFHKPFFLLCHDPFLIILYLPSLPYTLSYMLSLYVAIRVYFKWDFHSTKKKRSTHTLSSHHITHTVSENWKLYIATKRERVRGKFT